MGLLNLEEVIKDILFFFDIDSPHLNSSWYGMLFAQ